MPRLVTGTSKNAVSSALVRDVSPAYYIEYIANSNNKLNRTSDFMNLTGITDLGDYVLQYAYDRSSVTSANFSGLTKISGHYALYKCFDNDSALTSIDFSNLVEISGNYALYNAFTNASITSIIFDSLETVSSSQYAFGYCFSNCRYLTSVNFPKLSLVSGSRTFESTFAISTSNNHLTTILLPMLEKVTGSYALSFTFRYCKATSISLPSLIVASGQNCIGGTFMDSPLLTSIHLDKLITAQIAALGSCFRNCTALVDFTLPSLKNVSQQTFENMLSSSTSLKNVYFPALTPSSFNNNTSSFYQMLRGVTGCTVHFPSNIQNTISTWTDVVNGFAGTNTAILYDLPSTNHLMGNNSIEYERNPKEDTQSALAWRVLDGGTIYNPIIDWTPYYTNELTDPTVGVTIYSDAACTTAVTTISAIA